MSDILIAFRSRQSVIDVQTQQKGHTLLDILDNFKNQATARNAMVAIKSR